MSRVSIALSDPEATVQPDKTGKVCPSFKPLIVVDSHRFIVGQHVESASEIPSVTPALKQARAILGTKLESLSADTGFCSFPGLASMEEHSDRILSPPREPALGECVLPSPPGDGGLPDAWGPAPPQTVRLPMTQGKFDKQAFSYAPSTETMVCPIGRPMQRRQVAEDVRQKLTVFHGQGCASCPLRSQCTDAKTGRVIKWYEVDDKKQQMRASLREPANAEQYALRKETVELTWAEFKARFKLTRFRRRGLVAVRAEFALWCLAYNLWRTLSILGLT